MHTSGVRAATVEDAPGIARVLVDGWRTTYAGILPAEFLESFTYDGHEAGTRQHLASLPASAAVIVAVEDGGIAGVAHVREADSAPEGFTAELDALYVLPSAQRRRHGSRLLLAASRWLLNQGHRTLFLWVLRDNPCRRFYDGVGGEILGLEKGDELGGVTATSVAYGWRDLDALAGRLARAIDTAAGNA